MWIAVSCDTQLKKVKYVSAWNLTIIFWTWNCSHCFIVIKVTPIEVVEGELQEGLFKKNSKIQGRRFLQGFSNWKDLCSHSLSVLYYLWKTGIDSFAEKPTFHEQSQSRILLKCQEELSLMWGSHKAWLVFMTCVLIKLNTMYPPNELTCVYQGQIMKKLPGFKQLGRSVIFRIIL